MDNIKETNFGKVKVIQRDDYKWGIEDINGNIIVPFGYYMWIDMFWNDLARVKKDNKWGVINMDGKEVVPVIFDNIWNFYGKGYDSIIVEKGGLGNTANIVRSIGHKDKPAPPDRFEIKFDNLTQLIRVEIDSPYDNKYTFEKSKDGTWMIVKIN